MGMTKNGQVQKYTSISLSARSRRCSARDVVICLKCTLIWYAMTDNSFARDGWIVLGI